MRLTFDLGDAQSSRVIDQAIRHRSTVALEPRAWTDDGALSANIRGGDTRSLLVESADGTGPLLETLIGVHVDAQLTLGQTLYLFDTHVVDVRQDGDKVLLLLARPPILQVSQRRRFQRMTLKSPCTVQLNPRGAGASEPVTGQLLNLSADGMACRLSQAAAQSTRVGEHLRATFHPPEAERGFEFDVVLTNKSKAGTKEHVLLGLQFHLKEADSAAQAERERLCELLYGYEQATVSQEGER